MAQGHRKNSSKRNKSKPTSAAAPLLSVGGMLSGLSVAFSANAQMVSPLPNPPPSTVYRVEVTDFLNRDVYRSGLPTQTRSFDGDGRLWQVSGTRYVVLSAEPPQTAVELQRYLSANQESALLVPQQRPVAVGQGNLPVTVQSWHVAVAAEESIATEGGSGDAGLPPGPANPVAVQVAVVPADLNGLRTRKRYAYDRFGNVVGYCDSGVLDVPLASLNAAAPFTPGDPLATDKLLDDDVCARIDYSRLGADLAANLTGLPTGIQVFGGVGSDQVLQVNADGVAGTPTTNPNQTGPVPTQLRQRRAEYQPGQGLLAAMYQDRLDAPAGSSQGTPGTSEVTRLSYETDGQLATLLPPDGDLLTFAWEPLTRSQIFRVTDSFGEYSETRYTPQTLSWGLPSQEFDLNGAEIRYGYDAFARLQEVRGPYDLSSPRPTVAFEYHPEGLYPAGSPSGILPWAGSRKLDLVCNESLAFDRAACLGNYAPLTLDRVVYTDGLGRARQVQEDARVNGQDGRRIGGSNDYDAFGRAYAEFAPRFDAGRTWPIATAGDSRTSGFLPGRSSLSPKLSRFDHDDRVIEATQPDGSLWRTAYRLTLDPAGLLTRKTTSTDPLGATTHHYEDADGETTAVTSVDRDTQQESKLTYRYDPMGQLTDVLETGGGHTHADYDGLGRMTLLENPDTGQTRKIYGPTGQLASMLRPDGRSIGYTYDKSRLVSVIPPEAPRLVSTGGVQTDPVYTDTRIVYTYGHRADGLNGAGRVVAIKHQAGIDQTAFGLLGEAAQETHTLIRPNPVVPSTPANPNPLRKDTFVFQNIYDSWGRLRKRMFPAEPNATPTGLAVNSPAPEVLTYQYDRGGLVNRLTGRLPYQLDMWYDEWGDKTAAFYGNAGANADGGVKETWRYDLLERRLAQKQTLLPNIAKVRDGTPTIPDVIGPASEANATKPGTVAHGVWPAQDIDYRYDLVGRMESLTDSSPAYPGHPLTATLSQTYGYDDFGRVTSATGLRLTRNLAGLEENDSYVAEYGYDALHNLTKQVLTHTPKLGAASKGRAYAYSYGSARPHAVTRVNNNLLDYDANGQRVGWGRIQGQAAQAPVMVAAPVSTPAVPSTPGGLTPQSFQRLGNGQPAPNAGAGTAPAGNPAFDGALRAIGGQRPPADASRPPSSALPSNDPRSLRPQSVEGQPLPNQPLHQ